MNCTVGEFSSVTYWAANAENKDASEIANIVNEAICRADYFRKEEAMRITPEEVMATIENPMNKRWFVLKVGGNENEYKCVATFLLEARKNHKGTLRMFATHVNAQHRKLGLKLLIEIEKKLVHEKINRLSLWCAEEPGLIKYYEMIGFQKTTKRKMYDKMYLKDEYIDRIAIVKMIKFLELYHI